MEERSAVLEFTLSAPGCAPVAVRLRRYLDRWIAELLGAGEPVAIGSTAREALTTALVPLGPARAKVLLADLGLLEPSIQVAEIERASGGAA
jgi:hypothetical protein